MPVNVTTMKQRHDVLPTALHDVGDPDDTPNSTSLSMGGLELTVQLLPRFAASSHITR
jgi:hypothetical protein